MKKYTVTNTWNLRSLCIRKDWFTCGTNSQYDKMFALNENGANIEDIALAIWLCSDDEQNTYESILNELKAEHEEYLESIAWQQQADGERAADEIYCGYFD